MKLLSDPELFKLIQNQDERAFGVLLDRHSAFLYDLVYKRIKDDDDTKDIIQEIFITIWNNKLNITVEASLSPYLTRAAKYAVIDRAIRQQRVTAHQHHLLKSSEQLTHHPEHTLIVDELKRQLAAEVDRMPDTMREVFRLSREEHLTSREIAVRLQLSEQTVRNNITLALKKLKLSLDADQLICVLPLGMAVTAALIVN